ncbi:MAG: Ferric uptake regulator [Candidatus Roizmanbacteria bacterium GW2011_GWA2_35_8]|uniref:Ferric uptake regulator n=1 Tax=Candidatus Roizmanbacteria bacterium GW2011_GWA2_35_8 TaxID=1618479 RepID=A0A0G0FEV8_9BACT|nr:MAG: Ferric uptake regulator [Candidatus Roizmanbacteria bacterium GW2011_GWA2_35_8]
MIGQRYTKTRKKIFKALSISKKPITVQEIFKYLKKNREKINLASIYRNLNLMEKSGLVSVVLFGEGKKRFELKDKSAHHHHFFCKNCGEIEDVEMKEDDLMTIFNKSRFLIKEHKLEFFGLCPDCQ